MALSSAQADAEKILARHREHWMRETLRWATQTATAWAALPEVVEAIGRATPDEIVAALDPPDLNANGDSRAA